MSHLHALFNRGSVRESWIHPRVPSQSFSKSPSFSSLQVQMLGSHKQMFSRPSGLGPPLQVASQVSLLGPRGDFI